MFMPTLIIVATVGFFTIRNAKAFNLYLITLFILGIYFLVGGVSNLFFGL